MDDWMIGWKKNRWMVGWIEKKIKKQMDGWMDKKYIKIDGRLDG